MLERKVAANRMEKDAELQNTIDEQKQHLKDAKAENKVALKEKDEEMKEPPIVIPPITTILLPTTTSTPPHVLRQITTHHNQQLSSCQQLPSLHQLSIQPHQ